MIVESPNKVKTISQIFKTLGYDNIIVMASVGHISDIANTGNYNMGIDENTFEANYEITPNKKDIVNKLKEQVRLVDKVLLASDPDREGEAIAWSLKKFLNIPDKKYERITYHEITKEAIKKAMESPTRIDENLVHAAHARGKLDKIIGFRLSPIARIMTNAVSVGRCQSAGLKLVVDREKEILNFIPQKYFELWLNFKKNKSKFKAKYIGEDKKKINRLNCKSECDSIANECQKGKYIISNITKKEISQKAPLPFTTSTFQQEAASKLGISINDAMTCAQKLFEGIDLDGKHVALITYLRTDSADIASEFLPTLKSFIISNYGKNYYSGSREIKKKENVQAGHECLRVIDLSINADKLKKYISDNRLIKIYDIIYRRTLASVMKERKLSDTQYTIKNGKHNFEMSFKEERFDGWKKVYTYQDNKDEEKIIKESFIVGEETQQNKLEVIEKITQPPTRYSEPTLIKTLDKLGIGRPSTYETIISTLLDKKRDYCHLEKDKLTPTTTGIRLVEFLDKNFSDITNSAYTANMEKRLDEISNGNEDEQNFLSEVYAKLNAEINKTMGEDNGKKCPLCGGILITRKGKYGFFLGCSNYPKCHYLKSVKQQ